MIFSTITIYLSFGEIYFQEILQSKSLNFNWDWICENGFNIFFYLCENIAVGFTILVVRKAYKTLVEKKTKEKNNWKTNPKCDLEKTKQNKITKKKNKAKKKQEYIYIYTHTRGSLNKFPDSFVWALLLIVHT